MSRMSSTKSLTRDLLKKNVKHPEVVEREGVEASNVQRETVQSYYAFGSLDEEAGKDAEPPQTAEVSVSTKQKNGVENVTEEQSNANAQGQGRSWRQYLDSSREQFSNLGQIIARSSQWVNGEQGEQAEVDRGSQTPRKGGSGQREKVRRKAALEKTREYLSDIRAKYLKNNSEKSNKDKFMQQDFRYKEVVFDEKMFGKPYVFLSVAFLVIGLVLHWKTGGVAEVTVDYTHCKNSQNVSCSKMVSENKSCECFVNIPSSELGSIGWTKDVFVYYGLENFYQNHRRYVSSRDAEQLYGGLLTANDNGSWTIGTPSENCSPLIVNPKTKLPYFPCGLAANAFFNDTIALQYRQNETNNWTETSLIRKGIAWEVDKQRIFRNPSFNNHTLRSLLEGKVSKPMDWQKNIWDLENGLENEDLIVWMRSSHTSNFRKLYGKLNTRECFFASGLPVQNVTYRFRIGYNYDVTRFQGKKKIILAETYVLGSKNSSLGIMFMFFGSLFICLKIIIRFKFRSKEE